MILDIQTQLATAYAPTSTGTTTPGPVVDLEAVVDLGMGNDVIFYLQQTVTATSGGSATVDFQLIGNATDPTFASNNFTIIDQGAIALATLVAGYEQKIKYPRGFLIRYLKLAFVIGTAALTAGTWNAWLLNDAVQDIRAYPAGYANPG
jgi:hypothetical protein